MTDSSTNQPKPAKRNRQLLLIIGIALVTTIVPYLMYYTGVGIPEGTRNEGVLISDPILLEDFTFYDESGESWLVADQRPRFRLYIPVRGECGETCRETLYLTRQVDIRLGRDRDQLERIYVQLDGKPGAAFQQFLSEEHPNLVYLQGDREEWQEALRERPELSAELDGSEYYLAHRYGALAMAYNEQHTGNQLLDDLEFLISTSN